MTARKYAQIECALTGSKKVRGLRDHATKWVYLCAHLSDFCGYTGLFRYPMALWSHDAQLDIERLEAAIEELVNVGLIEHDPEEEFIRIVGWCHKRSGPDNPNRVDSLVADLRSLDEVPAIMFCASVAELAVASVRRSLQWKEYAPGRPQLYATLKSFLPEVYQDHQDVFLNQLGRELETAPAAVRQELNVIFPVLAIQMDQPFQKGSERVPPTLPEHETKRDEDQTKTKQDEDEYETARFSECDRSQSLQPVFSPQNLRTRGPKSSTLNSGMARSARGETGQADLEGRLPSRRKN